MVVEECVGIDLVGVVCGCFDESGVGKLVVDVDCYLKFFVVVCWLWVRCILVMVVGILSVVGVCLCCYGLMYG